MTAAILNFLIAYGAAKAICLPLAFALAPALALLPEATLAIPHVSLFDQIKDIAYPIALLIFFIMQKLDAMKAAAARETLQKSSDAAAAAQKKATNDAAVALQNKLEAQDRAALQAAAEVKDKLATTAETQRVATVKAAAEVKLKLDADAVATRLKMEEIHIDVNSKMGAQKKKTWDFALMLARRADATPADQAAAREAEKDYLDHMAAQARADERVRLFLATQPKPQEPTQAP